MADFETPELRKIPVVPKIEPGATSHLAPYVAKPDIQKPLGYPGELVDNWEQVAIDKLGELKGKYRSLQVFLDACVSVEPAPTSAITTWAPLTRRTCRWHARTCYAASTDATTLWPANGFRSGWVPGT